MAMGLKSKAGNRNGVTMDNQMNQYDNGGGYNNEYEFQRFHIFTFLRLSLNSYTSVIALKKKFKRQNKKIFLKFSFLRKFLKAQQKKTAVNRLLI